MPRIDELINAMDIRAIIFDLDGTLLDNNAFHLKAWKEYLHTLGREVSQEEYNAHINGRTNKDVVEYIYNRNMDDEEAMKYAEEKEATYRKLYEPYIKPVAGLVPLLEDIKSLQVPMAIATSGIKVNIDFMFAHVPIRQYFKIILDSSNVKKGKPDPEIYINTARALAVVPANCLVFEDAVVGIDAAQTAGMKTIAITTTHTKEELKNANYIIHDYTKLLN